MTSVQDATHGSPLEREHQVASVDLNILVNDHDTHGDILTYYHYAQLH